MHVVATAGHVDHGKSTLVRALTGTDPDRLEEEHRRGLSIQLGYCWTELDPVGEIAFVDVPGHERFVSTMLAGVGPVPAVLFVVAADDPWMPQAAEHLAALDALGVDRGILVVTRSDLADPGPALGRARSELAGTSLRGVPAVAVSGATGAGLEELRGLLAGLVAALPRPAAAAPVRLWADRCFHIKGAGTVVTGTLPSGTVSVGDTLEVGAEPGETRSVRVRGVQSLGRPVERAHGVARVALNLTGPGAGALDRSSVLVTPGEYAAGRVVDVLLTRAAGSERDRPPERPMLHVGAAAMASRLRPLDLARGLARLALDRPLPLRVGDRALLRDPGSRAVWGVQVVDPAPDELPRRRGAAADRASALQPAAGRIADGQLPSLELEVARRGLTRLSLLRRLGVPGATTEGARRVGLLVRGDWVLGPERAARLRERLLTRVRAHDEAHPMAGGIPQAELANELGLPTLDLLLALLAEPLEVREGRVTGRPAVILPPHVARAVASIEEELTDAPFVAPHADRLHELGMDGRALAAAEKAGRLLRVAPGVVLLPGAAELAARWLADLPQPFTTSQARERLGTSRRVVLPLLDLLDRRRVTRRLPDDRRELLAP
ncbi:MAG TPA: SelB C-terminal domain-containing protein [Nocardioidaceae bacterium]|nr:SelB C-terminal domain-containing protein [Nocardioidaceae bacterium]